jgi:hypothetical protein
MKETGDGRKRLELRMTRGSFRFALCAWVGQTVISALLALNALVWRSPSDPPLFFLALGLFVVCTIYLGYLLRVRRNDAPFWDDEEARRADWDRRGRQL